MTRCFCIFELRFPCVLKVVFWFKQEPFSLLKSKVFDLSKILWSEIYNGKILKLSYLGKFESCNLAEIKKLLYYFLIYFQGRNPYNIFDGNLEHWWLHSDFIWPLAFSLYLLKLKLFTESNQIRVVAFNVPQLQQAYLKKIKCWKMFFWYL